MQFTLTIELRKDTDFADVVQYLKSSHDYDRRHETLTQGEQTLIYNYSGEVVGSWQVRETPHVGNGT